MKLLISNPLRNLTRACLRVTLVGLALPGCQAPDPGPTLGSNSNWLLACTADGDCDSALSCRCQVCSSDCQSDDDCTALPGTHCVSVTDAPLEALCGGTSGGLSSGRCLSACSAGSCGNAQACVLGACVPQATPTVAFCADLTEPSQTQRTRLDELVDAVQQLRKSGTVNCGATPAGVLPYVRLEPKLSCSAQVLVDDIAVTGTLSLTDSQGRTTTERLTAAGYASRTWAEGYAKGAANPTAALQSMLSDADFCAGFSNAALSDLGVGISGTTYVVTLASE